MMYNSIMIGKNIFDTNFDDISNRIKFNESYRENNKSCSKYHFDEDTIQNILLSNDIYGLQNLILKYGINHSDVNGNTIFIIALKSGCGIKTLEFLEILGANIWLNFDISIPYISKRFKIIKFFIKRLDESNFDVNNREFYEAIISSCGDNILHKLLPYLPKIKKISETCSDRLCLNALYNFNNDNSNNLGNVITKIGKYLDIISIRNLRMVCKDFYLNSRHIKIHDEIKHGGMFKFINSDQIVNFTGIPKFLSSRNMKYLNIHHIKSKLDYTINGTLFPRIKILKVDGDEDTHIKIENCDTIEKIKIINCEDVVIGNCKKLKEIEIHVTNNITFNGKLNNLKSINLECISFNHNGIIQENVKYATIYCVIPYELDIFPNIIEFTTNNCVLNQTCSYNLKSLVTSRLDLQYYHNLVNLIIRPCNEDMNEYLSRSDYHVKNGSFPNLKYLEVLCVDVNEFHIPSIETVLIKELTFVDSLKTFKTLKELYLVNTSITSISIQPELENFFIYHQDFNLNNINITCPKIKNIIKDEFLWQR